VFTKTKVPFLDLRVLDESERAELQAAFTAVLDHGRIILGPECGQLEERCAGYIGRKFAAGVNSGTDALILAMRALGIGPGDEVITTPLSFIATANAIRLNGAVPVFADIGRDMNLDPASIEPLVTPKTRAIIPVHWAGKVCRMEEIMPIAERHGLTVIEDGSQAFGASRHGRKAGTWGRIACFSMNSMKTFASLGEAGMLFTDEAELHARLDALRYNGLVNREYCHYVSHNGRLDTIQAAVLLKRFDRYEALLARRRANAAFYDRHLGQLVRVPAVDPGCEDAFYIYIIQTERRDALRDFLAENGIETKIQHAPLMPRQPAYENSRGAWPNADRIIATMLSLPIHEKLTDDQLHHVVDCVKRFFA
jgi:dTDP-4-amino-4,6-dideoxygalactose transaminase